MKKTYTDEWRAMHAERIRKFNEERKAGLRPPVGKGRKYKVPDVLGEPSPQDNMIASAVLEEAARRNAVHNIADEVCFDRQLAFLRDPAKWKAIFTPRRSGKSYTFGVALLEGSLAYPGRKQLFIAKTAEQAETIIYKDIFAVECERRKIPVKYNSVKHVITMPNDSTIKLFGMDSSPAEMEKVLGGKYHRAIIDECQSFSQDLKAVVEAKLAPAVTDFLLKGGGEILLGGTPGKVMGNHYWWQITKQDRDGRPSEDRMPGWSVHEWHVANNPHMAAAFAAECERRYKLMGPQYQEQPDFRREWLGQWVLDAASKVYKFDESKNVVTDQGIVRDLMNVGKDWEFIAGVDLGWEDATAITIGAWSKRSPNFYIVLSEKVKHTVISQIGAALVGYMSRFGIKRFILDTGGIGKQLAESLREQFRLPIFPADKREKEDTIGRMNSDLLCGRVQVIASQCAPLVDEWSKLTVDEKAWNAGYWKEAERHANHCFVAGTTVSTARGPVPIERVHAHDVVPTRKGMRRVMMAGHTRKRAEVWRLRTSDRRELVATPDHRIWTKARGWVELQDLSDGDMLSLENGQTVHVASVDPFGKADVFDLSVEHDHEFFAEGVLVHNCADSALYCWRASMHHAYQEPEKPREPDLADMLIARKRLVKTQHDDEDIWDAQDREEEVKDIVRRFRGGK